jgi:hypothetical protein
MYISSSVKKGLPFRIFDCKILVVNFNTAGYSESGIDNIRLQVWARSGSLMVESIMFAGNVQESSSLLGNGGLLSRGQMDVDVTSINEDDLAANNGGLSLACKI